MLKKIFKKIFFHKKNKLNNICIDTPDNNIKSFSKMDYSNGSFYFSSDKKFNPKGILKQETIERVFNFAYDMTFGDVGEHRNHRSGGTYKRKNGEIFANTFQGKIAECATCNLLFKYEQNISPDFSVSKLGTWDSGDLTVCNKKIAIKSTKSYGQLLLLETKDWDCNGFYLPNNDTKPDKYDIFLLIRIKPNCEEIMKHNRLLLSDKVDKDFLHKIIISQKWEYDCPGYITYDDFVFLIKNKFLIEKGQKLNGKTVMDADNYYVKACELRNIKLINEHLI